MDYVTILCDKCNNPLEIRTTKYCEIYITPCELCIQEEYNKGYSYGRNESEV